jgi:hypothetical protein
MPTFDLAVGLDRKAGHIGKVHRSTQRKVGLDCSSAESTFYVSGHNYPECAGANAVMKRGVHDTDFTVSGYVYPSSSGPHPYLLHLESIQILVGLMPENRPQSVRTKVWRSTRGAVRAHSWPESSLERVPIFNPAVWYRLLPTNKNGVTCSNASAWSMCTFIRRLTFWNLDRLPRLRPAYLARPTPIIAQDRAKTAKPSKSCGSNLG